MRIKCWCIRCRHYTFHSVRLNKDQQPEIKAYIWLCLSCVKRAGKWRPEMEHETHGFIPDPHTVYS